MKEGEKYVVHVGRNATVTSKKCTMYELEYVAFLASLAKNSVNTSVYIVQCIFGSASLPPSLACLAVEVITLPQCFVDCATYPLQFPELS